MPKQTTKNKQEKETLENILRLEPLRNKLAGSDLQKLDSVLENLQRNVGNTVSKSNAAEILKVSRQTVDRWVDQGLMPVRTRSNGRQAIPRDAFERIAHEVDRIKDMGQTRTVLADALYSVADEIAPKKKASEKIKDAGVRAKKAQKTKAKKAQKTKGQSKSQSKKTAKPKSQSKKAAKSTQAKTKTKASKKDQSKKK